MLIFYEGTFGSDIPSLPATINVPSGSLRPLKASRNHRLFHQFWITMTMRFALMFCCPQLDVIEDGCKRQMGFQTAICLIHLNPEME
jgi:hypothetical protein